MRFRIISLTVSCARDVITDLGDDSGNERKLLEVFRENSNAIELEISCQQIQHFAHTHTHTHTHVLHMQKKKCPQS